MLMAEDAEFAMRLRQWGRKNGKKYGTVKLASMTTSCRKFDAHGDWILFKNPGILMAYLKGNNRKYADEVYYENER